MELTGARWRKSRRSAQDGNCVEVATNLRGAVAVRDSKDRVGPVLAFTPAAWRAFLAGVTRYRLRQQDELVGTNRRAMRDPSLARSVPTERHVQSSGLPIASTPLGHADTSAVVPSGEGDAIAWCHDCRAVTIGP